MQVEPLDPRAEEPERDVSKSMAMQDQSDTGSAPQVPPVPSRAASSSGLFSERVFPGTRAEPPQTPRAAAPQPSSGARQAWNIVLVIVLFVLAISGVAWVAQNLPSWRTKPVSAPVTGPKNVPAAKADLLEFAEIRSVWDPEDEKYAREYERRQKGRYDYPFKNVSGQIVELGLVRTSCDCSKVEVAVFPPSDMNWKKYQDSKKKERIVNFPSGEGLPWKPLPIDERKGIEVPQGHMGLLRLSWEGKQKSDGEYLRLSLFLWAQPKGHMSARQFPAPLETGVLLTPALRFVHDSAGKILPAERVSVGILAARDVGKASFYCWSATRPELSLTLLKDKAKEDGGFEFSIDKMSEGDGLALEKKLRDAGINTRVQSAYRVHVKILEPLMDQGPFNTSLPLEFDGERFEGGPVVTGYVRGEVQIGNSDSGRVELPSFLVKDGVPQHVVPLTAEGNVQLTHESHYPAFLQVKLEKNVQESNQGRTRWNLTIRIPPHYAHPGPLPPNSAVILRTGGSNSRAIRIPVVGNAVQG